ncbi:MAG: 2-dehydropantoate 2-reductase [Lachnospiraceae bacterium]|nr:2-dehydropantoate 2-reductase [Lachnospiraceae bacterium]
MKIAVLGAGAMGSMLGAYLQLGGADVTLLVRRKELADKLANPGIVMRSYTGENGEKSETDPIPMKAACSCEGLEKQDAVLIMVKGCDTKSALEGAASIIGENTKIITLQNGIGNTDIIAESVNKDNIYYGCVNMSAIMSAPAVLDTGLFGDVNVVFGSVTKDEEQKKFGDELAGIFNASGIKAAYTEDIDTEVWYKLLVNIAVNAGCGLVRLRGGEAGNDQDFTLLAVDMLKEAIAVGASCGVNLDFNYFMTHILPVARKTSGLHYPSMAQDMLMKKAPTEIEFINGAVERLGKKAGIPTPVNTTVSRLVRTIERNYDKQYKDKTAKSGPSFKVKLAEKFCKGCGYCIKYCPKHVLTAEDGLNAKGYVKVKVANEADCIGCLSCSTVCPEAAISIIKED